MSDVVQQETESGIKRLSTANWLEPDRVSTFFSRLDKNGHPIPMTGGDWAQHILAPQLCASVPAEVKKRFEVARGALLYGFYFYPLYTLGVEQVYRVVDTAAGAKCSDFGESIDYPRGKWNFAARVKCLGDHGTIPACDLDRWRSHVELRNLTSHSQEQAIINPGMALGLVVQIVEDINSLFG